MLWEDCSHGAQTSRLWQQTETMVGTEPCRVAIASFASNEDASGTANQTATQMSQPAPGRSARFKRMAERPRAGLPDTQPHKKAAKTRGNQHSSAYSATATPASARSRIKTRPQHAGTHLGVLGNSDAGLGEVRRHRVAHLSLVDVQRRAVGGDGGVRDKHGVAVDVGAAQVEEPRDFGEVVQQEGVRARRRGLAPHRGQLVRDGRARVLEGVHARRLARPARPRRPDPAAAVTAETELQRCNEHQRGWLPRRATPP